MFKRKLFKRALPFILSVAMMFESLPATAMATESSGAEQMTETERQSEEGGEERSGSESEESAEAASTEERLSEESSGSESGSESEEAPTSEESSGSESGSESEASTPSGSETPSTSEEWSESGSESETPSTSEESSGSEHEDEREEIEQKEVDAEETVNKKYETEIRLFKNANNEDVKVDKVNGFTHILEGEGEAHKFSTEYTDPSQCGNFIEALKPYIKVFVDNESVDKDNLDKSIAERFEFEWKAEKDGAYTESVSGAPAKVGNYELTIKLPAIDKLCKETTTKVYVKIEQASLVLDLSGVTQNGKIFVKPGTTVEEFTKDITSKYELRYSNNPAGETPLVVNKDAVKSFTVNVHESNAGEDAPLPAETVLSARKDYIVHITVEMKDESCYSVAVDDAYNVTVGNLQETRVEVNLDQKSYTKVYDGNPADPAVFKGDAKVFVVDGTTGEDIKELTSTDASMPIAELGWYRREQNPNAWTGNDVITDTAVMYASQKDWRYIKLDTAPTDAGDYYAIWKYAGDELNAYEQSVSEPVTFTLEPAPVVITIAQDEAALGKMFYEGMDADDIAKVLTQIEYKVSTVNAEGVVDAASDIKTDSFFGTGYAGDAASPATSYYKPVFKLQRSISKVKGTAVEEKDREWKNAINANNALFDAGDKGRLILKDDDHEYEYRVVFTGKKTIFNQFGGASNTVDITELSTDSADRNHLVKVDEKTIDENAKIASITSAKEVVINTDAIVAEFNGKTNVKAENTGDGSLENPAVKIYDENALFADRASYKKATVSEKGTNASVSGKLTYRWGKASLKDYEDYLEKTQDEKDSIVFTDRYVTPLRNGMGSTDDEGVFVDTVDANQLYELTINFEDETSTYRPEEKKVYFKVEAQQIVIVPNTQVAQDGQNIANWLGGTAGNAGLDKSLYKVYKLPYNDRKEFDATTDKSGLEIVLRENKDWDPVQPDPNNQNTVGGYDLPGIYFRVMNLEKDAAGADIKDSYVDTKHDVFNHKADDKTTFTYGVTARYEGSNYTSIDKVNSVGGVTKYHDQPTEITFLGNAVLYPSINKDVINKLTKFYDGTALTQADIEGLVTLYSDKEKTKPVTDMLNTSSEYDPEKVNVYWQKDNKRYTTENVVWGGDYTLVLRFKGNEKYKPLTIEGNENTGESYEEWHVYNGTDGNDEYKFSIKRRKLTITPELKAESDIKAGDVVESLLLKQLTVGGDVLEQDKAYFEYKELEKGALEKYAYIYADTHTVRTEKDQNGNDVAVPVYEWREYNALDEEQYNIGKDGGYPAFNAYPGFTFQIDDKSAIVNANEQYLRFNRKYTVNFANSNIKLIAPLADSYEVTFLSASRNVLNRGQGHVSKANYQANKQWNDKVDVNVELRYEYDGKNYSIRPLEAVPYVYDNININGTDFTGNLIAYRIYAPNEFEGDVKGAGFNFTSFIYEKAIREAGGELVADWTEDKNVNRHYIEVLFPVTEDNKERAFDITWEDGYTDTFKLVNVELEANLQRAVAPKSISFNTVQKKMAVGETQQLNVKITKAQLSDVIKIQYRIAGTENQTKNEFISIDPDTGVVTALHTAKKATTQIEAYPVYVDPSDGRTKAITGKGVKTAKTKITVTNVAVPSIKKVVTKDVTADVWYKDPGNGYRREFYVVEKDKSAAKKFKAADFESMISSVQNGRYKDAGFALTPIYSYGSNDYDDTAKLMIREIGDRDGRGTEAINEQLTPGKTYVVYVRNVSSERTLDDGSKVDFTYNGAVKSFVATKSQLQELNPYFKVNEDNTPVAKSAVKYLVTGYNADGTEIYNVNGNDYQIDLTAKTAQLSVNGLFWDMEGGNDAAELPDMRRLELPIAKKSIYLNPKLTYGVFDEESGIALEKGKWVFTGTKSKYATISNKGKLSLKGVGADGSQMVYVQVLSDNGLTTAVRLTIKSEITSVAGKKAKLTVGQTKPLADFLQYKNGKKKVANYNSTGIIITEETIKAAEAAGYKIEDGYERYALVNGLPHDIYSDQGWNEHPDRHYWYITAVAPNKKAFTLNFTDRTPDGTEIAVTKPVTLTSAAIQPVKNLKTAYVDDKNITINFKYTGTPDGYEIALMDARKNIIEKRYIGGDEYDVVKKDAPSYLQNYQNWRVNTGAADLAGRGYENFARDLVYFEKTKTFAYTFSSEKILRLSSYTVSVTPVYENQRPKTVSKKVKTTNIPAARYANVAAVPGDGNTGMDLTYAVGGTPKTNNGSIVKGEVSLYVNPYFQAGNVYTLRAGGSVNGVFDVNDDAKHRVTDTLTWKSSNTKVATIKANTGKYTATFRPLKAGETTITVTSKITKKVISRFTVRVKAIGNGDGFGGNYEPAGDDAFFGTFLAQWDPFYEGRLDVLSVNNPLTLSMQAYDRAWVSFTAPTFGQYTFNSDSGTVVGVHDAKNGTVINNMNPFLEAGQKVYLKVETTKGGAITLTANSTSFSRMTEQNNTLENAIAVKADEWIAFTAPEDNYYAFATDDTVTCNIKAIRKDNKAMTTGVDTSATVDVTDGKDTKTYKAWAVGLKAGETVFIYVDKASKLWVDYRKTDDKTTLEIDASGKKNTVPVELSKDSRQTFVKFTAPLTARYDFKVAFDKNVIVKLIAADGKSGQTLSDGDKKVVSGIAQLNADGKEEEKRPEATASVYMKAGETVMFSFAPNETLDASDKDKAFKKFEEDKDGNPVLDDDGKQKFSYITLKAEVSVTTPNIDELKLNTEATVAKADKDTNVATVASYKFVIPANANAKYLISNGGAALKFFDIKGRELTVGNSITVDADSKVSDITTVNNDDKVINPLKAGDTILIEATNTDTENEKKIKISELKVTNLEDGKSVDVTVSNNDVNNEFWFTFTAPADGVYDFKLTAEEKKDNVPSHNPSGFLGSKLFVVDKNTFGSAKSRKMKANEIAVIKMTVASLDGYDEKETTKITVSAVARPVTDLKLGDNSIAEIAKVNGEAYYRYKVEETDTYIFTWKADKDVDAIVSAEVNGKAISLSGTKLNAGNVVDITVKATTDKAKGTLNVAKESVTELKSGADAVKFEAKEDEVKDGAVKTIKYIFTAEDRADGTEYAIITTLDKDVATPEIEYQYNNDEASGTKAVTDIPGAQKFELRKGETITITLTAKAATSGTIKIQPTTPKEATPFTGETKVKVIKGSNAFYSYVVPEYGRYNFELIPEKDNHVDFDSDEERQGDGFTYTSRIGVYKNNHAYFTEGNILNKGDIVYFVVVSTATGDDELKEQSATLKMEKIKPTALEADKGVDVTIAKDKYAYYEFTAPEHARYNFNSMEAAKDNDGNTKNVGSVYGVYDDKTNRYLGDEKITLDKGDKVFIKLTAYVDDVSFKYTVVKTPINSLVLDKDVSATIKKEENAKGVTFGYKVDNVGMYAFQVTGEKLNVSVSGNGITTEKHNDETEKGRYIVQQINKTDKWVELTVTTSETEKDTSVSVKVVKVEPIVLEADKAEVSKDIAKGECVFVQFVPTVSARYSLTTGNDNVTTTKLRDEVLAKDAATYGEKNLIKLAVPGTSENKSEKVSLKVTTVKPEKEITKSESIKKSAVDVNAVWYTFKASKNAKYDFMLTNGKDKEEKVPYADKLEKFKDIRDEKAEKSLASEYMKAGDTILIRVDLKDFAKDTELLLEVTENEVEDFKEVSFTETSGLDKSEKFTAKKDETYTVTIVDKKNVKNATVTKTVTYKDKDGVKQPIEGKNTYRIDPAFTADTDVTVEFTLDKPSDADFYIFIEKDKKETTK